MRIGGSGADFLISLFEDASAPTALRAVKSRVCVFINVVRDGVST